MAIGFAKKQLLLKQNQNVTSSYPYIEAILHQGWFLHCDYMAANILLQSIPECPEDVVNENIILVLMYLFAAYRLGHLAIEISPKLFPGVDQIIIGVDKEDSLIDYQSSLDLTERINLGLKDLVPFFSTKELTANSRQLFYLDRNRLYFQKNYLLESVIIQHVQQHLQRPFLPNINWKKWDMLLDEYRDKKLLDQLQQRAIQNAIRHSLSIITGGPGTGKTYTAAAFLYFYFQSYCDSSLPKIIIAAPTGKAVTNLQEKIFNFDIRFFQQYASSLNFSTIHGLFYRKGYLLDKILHADLLIIDESSMIDASLMAKLFSALSPHIQVIFIGDKDQLPPVESGSIFHDFIDIFSKYGNAITQLETCFRIRENALLDLSRSIKLRNWKDSLEKIRPFFKVFDMDTPPKEIFDSICHYAYSRLPKAELTDHEALSAFQYFKLLTPKRKGLLGLESFNKALHKENLRRQSGFTTTYVPIMVIKNDPILGLYNGDMGVLALDISGKSYGLFSTYQDGQRSILKTALELLPSYEYAYAVSVHKSQGSEWQEVALAMPSGSECFGWQLLYTAMTRAKKEFKLFSTFEIFEKVFNRSIKRLSGVVERFNNSNQNLQDNQVKP